MLTGGGGGASSSKISLVDGVVEIGKVVVVGRMVVIGDADGTDGEDETNDDSSNGISVCHNKPKNVVQLKMVSSWIIHVQVVVEVMDVVLLFSKSSGGTTTDETTIELFELLLLEPSDCI
jgi:hypothetical protein